LAAASVPVSVASTTTGGTGKSAEVAVICCGVGEIVGNGPLAAAGPAAVRVVVSVTTAASRTR